MSEVPLYIAALDGGKLGGVPSLKRDVKALQGYLAHKKHPHPTTLLGLCLEPFGGPRGARAVSYERGQDYPLAGSAAILCTGGPAVIRTEAWPFYRTLSCVRLYWVLEEPKGSKQFVCRDPLCELV